MKLSKIKKHRKKFIAIVIFLSGMLVTQILFGGWGGGIINHFFNKPEIIVEQTIIFSEESPELIWMPAGMNPLGLAGLFITGIEIMDTNSTHCILSWMGTSDKIKNEIVTLRMDVITEINESSYPNGCNKNEDCVQFSYSLESQNYKDIDELYVEMCLGPGYSFLSKETGQYSDCITIQESFVPMQKEIHSGIYIKIHDTGFSKDIADYVENNAENLYPTILVRDRSHKVLSHKEIKIIIQDILNCKVIEPI